MDRVSHISRLSNPRSGCWDNQRCVRAGITPLFVFQGVAPGLEGHGRPADCWGDLNACLTTFGGVLYCWPFFFLWRRIGVEFNISTCLHHSWGCCNGVSCWNACFTVSFSAVNRAITRLCSWQFKQGIHLFVWKGWRYLMVFDNIECLKLSMACWTTPHLYWDRTIDHD